MAGITRENHTTIGVMGSTAANLRTLAELYAMEVGMPRVPVYAAADKAVRQEIKRLEKKLGVEVELDEGVDDA